MSTYTDQSDKHTFQLNGYSTGVQLSVHCQEALETMVSFGDFNSCGCRDTEKISNPSGTVVFEGTTYVLGDEFKIVHTISQANGNKITYTFPDDYQGEPDFVFEEIDDTIYYSFSVRFV